MEEKLEKTEGKEEKVVVKPYMVFGREFSLSNPDIIEYYKTRMKMMEVKFRLVGKINEHGQYKIANELRYDLIGMEKEIDEAGEDYYKAIALYMKKHFYFHIKITQIEDGKAKASLYLSEYVEDFLPSEYIVSHICDYVDVYDDEYRIRLRKAFNLVDVATKVDDFAVPELAVVMQDAFDLDIVVSGLYDMASQIYVMRMIKALEEGGEVGAKVLARYRELLSLSKDIEIDEKYRYFRYKALLDRAIDDLGGYEGCGLDPKVVALIMLEMNRTVKAISKASPRGIFEIDLPNKKDDKKSSSKSSGKSGGKKAPAKKDDKKKPAKKDKKKDSKKDDKKKGGDGVSEESIKNLYVNETPVATLSDNKFDTIEEAPKEEAKTPVKQTITKEVKKVKVEAVKTTPEEEGLSEDEIEDVDEATVETAEKEKLSVTLTEETTTVETKMADGTVVKEVQKEITLEAESLQQKPIEDEYELE